MDGQHPMKRPHAAMKIVSIEFGDKSLEEILAAWLTFPLDRPTEGDVHDFGGRMALDTNWKLVADGSARAGSALRDLQHVKARG